MANEALKRKLITGGKVLAAAGQGDFTRGHISARLEASHTRYSWVFRMGDASGALDAISYVSLIAGYAY